MLHNESLVLGAANDHLAKALAAAVFFAGAFFSRFLPAIADELRREVSKDASGTYWTSATMSRRCFDGESFDEKVRLDFRNGCPGGRFSVFLFGSGGRWSFYPFRRGGSSDSRSREHACYNFVHRTAAFSAVHLIVSKTKLNP